MVPTILGGVEIDRYEMQEMYTRVKLGNVYDGQTTMEAPSPLGNGPSREGEYLCTAPKESALD